MSHHLKIILVSAALAVFCVASGCAEQQYNCTELDRSATPVTGESIQDRKQNQRDRIANGVKSGQLTAGETANLEKKQAALNQEERNMRKLDNGKLTAADKRR